MEILCEGHLVTITPEKFQVGALDTIPRDIVTAGYPNYRFSGYCFQTTLRWIISLIQNATKFFV